MHILTCTLLILLLNFNLSGCAILLPDPHKLDIQQGNRVQQKDVNKLELGMSRNQVKFILGTPLLKDGFHGDRWDYIDYYKPGNGEPQQSRLSLIFKGDQLIKIDDSHFKVITNTETDQ